MAAESLIPALEQIIKRGGHLRCKRGKNWYATQRKIKCSSKYDAKTF